MAQLRPLFVSGCHSLLGMQGRSFGLSIAQVGPDLRAVLSALLTSGAIGVMDGYTVSVHNMYGMAAREGFMHARN